jgi:hypothetical protein
MSGRVGEHSCTVYRGAWEGHHGHEEGGTWRGKKQDGGSRTSRRGVPTSTSPTTMRNLLQSGSASSNSANNHHDHLTPSSTPSCSSDSSGLCHYVVDFSRGISRSKRSPTVCMPEGATSITAILMTATLTLVITLSDCMIPGSYFWNCIFRNPTHHHQRLQVKDERMLSRHCSGSNAPKPAMLLRHQYIHKFFHSIHTFCIWTVCADFQTIKQS